jgi:hypothetical protein
MSKGNLEEKISKSQMYQYEDVGWFRLGQKNTSHKTEQKTWKQNILKLHNKIKGESMMFSIKFEFSKHLFT